MVAAGITEVTVWHRPRVGILPTGDELVEPGTEPEPGQLVEFNSVMLSGMVHEWGGRPAVYPVAGDEPELVESAVAEAAHECTVLLIIGGSSAGRRDYVQQTIASLGELRVEAVAIMPGKPTAIGAINGTPVLAMPGYPVSCVVAAHQFLRPILATLLRTEELVPETVHTRFARKVPSKLGTEEFLSVRLARRQDRGLTAQPLPRGAGRVSSLVHADGVVRIPPEVEGYHPDQQCTAELLRPLRHIDHQITIAGCWEPAIELVIRHIRARHPELVITYDRIGSLAGIDALCRGETSLAACALPLDDTAKQDISRHLAHLVRDQQEALEFITICHRPRGFIVRKDNPKNIHNFPDLARPDIMLANRRHGSTARHILDATLRRHGINPRHIPGYTRQQTTHLAAAASVRSGIADVTFGSPGAAQRLGLGFVTLGTDAVFLVFHRTSTHPVTGLIRQSLDDTGLRTQIAQLASGYDPSSAAITLEFSQVFHLP